MNELQIFENEEFGEVRTVIIGGEIWFVGKDVAEALHYKNSRQAIATNVMDDDKGVHPVDTPSGKQNMTIVNESGLYSLVSGLTGIDCSVIPKAKFAPLALATKRMPGLAYAME